MNTRQNRIIVPNKGGVLLAVLLVILVLLAAAGGYYFYKNFYNNAPLTQEPNRACSMEAKQCPDGSYVGRSGPNCEFAPCPNSAATSTSQIPADWKIYRNYKYGFEFRYQPNLTVKETISSISRNILFVEFKNNNENINVSVYADDGLISKYIQQRFSEIMAGGLNSVAYSTKIGEANVNIYKSADDYGVLLSKDNIFVVITSTNLDAMKNILSTFKFTK